MQIMSRRLSTGSQIRKQERRSSTRESRFARDPKGRQGESPKLTAIPEANIARMDSLSPNSQKLPYDKYLTGERSPELKSDSSTSMKGKAFQIPSPTRLSPELNGISRKYLDSPPKAKTIKTRFQDKYLDNGSMERPSRPSASAYRNKYFDDSKANTTSPNSPDVSSYGNSPISRPQSSTNSHVMTVEDVALKRNEKALRKITMFFAFALAVVAGSVPILMYSIVDTALSKSSYEDGFLKNPYFLDYWVTSTPIGVSAFIVYYCS
eukprot:CAMPEP_0167743376 /NCGR_PEP_ID=MMETSP0110_2-20121227/1984_1 /TAXON_ID=629695 /ORGANISM="Gymnochlora sp., Strain CCMP2014" /LENGTH=264 /DNA_ID=CAMNT_0007627745 /DNA_START=419 /DNA_END=1209 /DNA_ORIENTATION=+